jgi:hypothetical protein
MSAADEAEALLRRRASVLRRIERVNATIEKWHEIEANEALPADLRRVLRRPEVSLGGCESLHLMLVEELARLDGAGGDSE